MCFGIVEGYKAQLRAQNKENLEEKLRKMQLSMAEVLEQSIKENAPHHECLQGRDSAAKHTLLDAELG